MECERISILIYNVGESPAVRLFGYKSAAEYLNSLVRLEVRWRSLAFIGWILSGVLESQKRRCLPVFLLLYLFTWHASEICASTRPYRKRTFD